MGVCMEVEKSTLTTILGRQRIRLARFKPVQRWLKTLSYGDIMCIRIPDRLQHEHYNAQTNELTRSVCYRLDLGLINWNRTPLVSDPQPGLQGFYTSLNVVLAAARLEEMLGGHRDRRSPVHGYLEFNFKQIVGRGEQLLGDISHVSNTGVKTQLAVISEVVLEDRI